MPFGKLYFLTRKKSPYCQNMVRVSGVRREVLERDGWRCHYCNSSENLVLDHVIPKCKGGGNSAENLVAACFSCNSSKGRKGYDEFSFYMKAEKIGLEAFLIGVECD